MALFNKFSGARRHAPKVADDPEHLEIADLLGELGLERGRRVQPAQSVGDGRGDDVIVGVLGGYIGGRAVERAQRDARATEDPEPGGDGLE